MRNNLLEKCPLLMPAICMMVGIIIGDYLMAEIPLLPIFIGMVVVSVLLWRFEVLQSVAIVMCFFFLGWLLISWQKEKSKTAWPEEEVVYEAVVMSEPVEKPKTMAVDILITGNGQKLKCYLYKDDRSKALRIGDGLKVQSKINPNSDWHSGNFNYRRYLEIHGFSGNTFVSSWKWQKAQVSLSGISRLERSKLFFLKLRSSILDRIRNYQSADAYAVVAAMALGDKSALTKELKDVYSITGASHVLALSGLHLGIIYTLLSLLVRGRRWQMASQLLIILSIWAFAFLVGLSTSVVRSAMMLSIYALMSLGHRDKMSVNTLAFSAIVLLIVNPLSLFDVGFQMSFMAVFAILILYPLFEGVFSQEFLMSHRIVRWVWAMVTVSCAAQIGIAPLIAYYFGRFSTYFLLTNFVVIPATTLILYLSLLVFIVPSLAYLLLYVVGLLNSVLTKMAALPGASIDGLTPTVLQVVMVYVIIASCYFLVFFLRKNSKGAYMPT